MRRVVWSVLTGLGAFFIVLAIMSWLYVPGQAVKFPLNEYSVSTLVANNASWFSPKSVSELSNVTLQITSTVKGDVTAANSLGSSKIRRLAELRRGRGHHRPPAGEHPGRRRRVRVRPPDRRADPVERQPDRRQAA